MILATHTLPFPVACGMVVVGLLITVLGTWYFIRHT